MPIIAPSGILKKKLECSQMYYRPHHKPIGLASWAAADPLRPLYACPQNSGLRGLCRSKEACTPPLCLQMEEIDKY